MPWVLSLLTTLAALAGDSDIPSPRMQLIPASLYQLLFRTEEEPKQIQVLSFQLDITPVSNQQFLEFVRQHPKWRRSQVKRLFADVRYLEHWAGDLDLGPDSRRLGTQPVTHVSWFAAKAFATAVGKRLPTTAEWERVAQVGFTKAKGGEDAEFVTMLNHWYSSPSVNPLPVASTLRTNLLGIHAMHGLIWEWTSDFNSAVVTGDARGDTGLERSLFCGNGSAGATDRTDYPAFMRFGMRSSLKGSYALPNLGFRCAKDFP